MARAFKEGLDYFPHTCNYDDELKYIISLYGSEGYMIFFELLKRIYSGHGYYMSAEKKSIVLFSSEINVSIKTINDVINEGLCQFLFNKRLHKKYNILTSSGIQQRYFEAIKRRKETTIINEYILIDNVDILLNNVNINRKNVNRSTQRTVQESKVQESTVNIDFEIFWKLYDKKRGNKEKIKSKWDSLTDKDRELIINYIPKYIKSQPDKQFRKDPQTFLNNESWNDEIIIPKNNNPKSVNNGWERPQN